MTIHLLSRGIVNGRSFIENDLMPRPRTASDESILDAAFRAIARLGPAKVTLADVAQEAGLAAATLVQRFGSKRGLLLALCRLNLESMDGCFAAIRAEHESPLEALVAASSHMARLVTNPEELANGLAFLQMDISDPEFRAIALQNSKALLAGYKALIDDAIAAAELIECESKKLAQAVNSISGGSIIGWAIMRAGSATAWVRSDVLTLLEPYRAKRQRAKPSRPSRPSELPRHRKPRSS
jgi:AcrR family transcriptional regulator